jgi:tetratricopeptide (TPR) repeat protein
MEHSVLEEIFVQRHSQVEELIDSIRSSVISDEKQHILLTGSRGIGKTHLVSLIYHRIREREELQKQLFIAWLSEEEWSITSFLDFLICIFNTKTDQPSPPSIESLYEMSVDAMEKEASVILKEFIGDRTLLLIVENLDEVLNGLDSEGQKQLRSFIEENPCVMLATASSLPNAVKRKSSTFYQFFNHQELEELKLEDARNLLANIANIKGNKELEDFIKEPTGFNRIKAVYHLAGGNHRLYVIFSEFLTHRNSLDQLVEAFMRTLDDLTPYYQDRMRSISPQQRKIIEFLCKTRTAVTVKEIAQRCFMTHQTASSQLKKLSEMGYVYSKMYGRESYYEVPDIMMRFCLELKKQQDESIQFFVNLFRMSFDCQDLQQRLEFIPIYIINTNFQEESFRDSLFKIQEYIKNFLTEQYYKNLNKYVKEGDAEKALNLAEELIKVRGFSQGKIAQIWSSIDTENTAEKVLNSIGKAIEIDKNNEKLWLIQGLILLCFPNFNQDAISSFDQVIKINENNFRAWYCRGLALANISSFPEALKSFNIAIRLNNEDSDAWKYRGIALTQLERYEEALYSFNKAIELEQDRSLWKMRGIVLYELEQYEEALKSFNEAIELDTTEIASLRSKGIILYKLKRYKEALKYFQIISRIDPENTLSWEYIGITLYTLKCYEDALSCFDHVIKIRSKYTDDYFKEEIEGDKMYYSFDKMLALGSGESDPFLNKAELLFIMNRWSEGLEVLNLGLKTLKYLSNHITQGTIVHSLFESTNDSIVWKARIESLIDIYDKYQASALLGKEIVLSIKSMTDMVGEKAAQAWLEIWKEIVGDRIEFKIPLRLLEAAVRYRQSKGDPRVLLRLPIEERKLLKPLLGLEESD